MRFGVAVTTFNRPAILADTLAALRRYCPDDTPIIVVDDGSKPAAAVDEDVTLIQHPSNLGIPAAKNRCLRALMDLGCDHLFLLDDDTRPVTDRWWQPYIEAPDHHYQYSWTRLRDGRHIAKMQVIYSDDTVTGYTWSMGCMLYVSAHAVETVGGMDPVFGKGMGEHIEWSQRIYHAGLTRFVHQGLTGSDRWWWAGDEHSAVLRSYHGWQQRLVPNEEMIGTLAGSTQFQPY